MSPGYFEVFKIQVKRGRTFNERDEAAAPAVVVINESMAKQYWKDGADPLDDRLVIGKAIGREFADEPVRRIVGVVADGRDNGLHRNPVPRMFIPQAQVPDAVNARHMQETPMAWVVRTRGEPHSMIGPIEAQLRHVTGLPVSNIHTMEEIDPLDVP